MRGELGTSWRGCLRMAPRRLPCLLATPLWTPQSTCGLTEFRRPSDELLPIKLLKTKGSPQRGLSNLLLNLVLELGCENGSLRHQVHKARGNCCTQNLLLILG